MLLPLPLSILVLTTLTILTIALPTTNPSPNTPSSLSLMMSKRVDGDGKTTITKSKDADSEDNKIPPPASGSGPSYADWMKNLYDMGGKTRRSISITTSPLSLSLSLSSIMNKRVIPDSTTPKKDEDEKIPPPVTGSVGPSYADWMKNLYDMGGGKARARRGKRDNRNKYKTSLTQAEIDKWRLEREGGNGFGREVGD